MADLINLQTNIEGKKAYFGTVQDEWMKYDCILGGHWEYHGGCFDTILSREGPETIYLRIPFRVVKGVLDQYKALIEFQQPFVIKHIVNFGLDHDENAFTSATGFNQFQKPIDTDAPIKKKNKWEDAGEKEVARLMQTVELM